MNKEFKNNFPNYDVKRNGKVYKNKKEMKPFKSNGYDQVLLLDKDKNRHIFGVHTVVAMKYLKNFYNGCVVHHKDKNKRNNSIDNLEIYSKSEHCRMHAKENIKFNQSGKNRIPWNKGMKMDDEFSKKCKEGIINKNRGFNGNQFVDKNKNKR